MLSNDGYTLSASTFSSYIATIFVTKFNTGADTGLREGGVGAQSIFVKFYYRRAFYIVVNFSNYAIFAYSLVALVQILARS